MLASLPSVDLSSSARFPAHLLSDALPEPSPVRPTIPPMAEFRPLTGLSLEELAAIAGCSVLSHEEMTAQGLTADEYRDQLRGQALAVQVTRYAERTRLFLGIRPDIAFALNDTATAAIGAIMTREGCPPPENTIFNPLPDERAEISLLSPACEVMARISFDVRGASTMDEVYTWLERTLAGERLFDLGIARLRNPQEYGEIAERVLSRLWDSLVPA